MLGSSLALSDSEMDQEDMIIDNQRVDFRACDKALLMSSQIYWFVVLLALQEHFCSGTRFEWQQHSADFTHLTGHMLTQITVTRIQNYLEAWLHSKWPGSTFCVYMKSAVHLWSYMVLTQQANDTNNKTQNASVQRNPEYPGGMKLMKLTNCFHLWIQPNFSKCS